MVEQDHIYAMITQPFYAGVCDTVKSFQLDGTDRIVDAGLPDNQSRLFLEDLGFNPFQHIACQFPAYTEIDDLYGLIWKAAPQFRLKPSRIGFAFGASADTFGA